MAAPNKQFPKDGQVIISIMKDFGITNYEPRVVNMLMEFGINFPFASPTLFKTSPYRPKKRYERMLKRRRDAVVEDFVKGEFLQFLKLADYAEVVIDSWKGTYGTCLCGDDDRQPAVPDFLEPNVRPDTPPAADAGAGEPLETGGEYAGEFGEEEGEYLLASAPGNQVTPTSHQCHINVTPKSRQGHAKVTSRSRQCHVKVTPTSHQCHANATLMSSQYHVSVTSLSLHGHINANPKSRQCYANVASVLRHGHINVTSKSRQRHTNATSKSSQCYVT
ncbi:unnamed protein product, partial [Nesidiocoris tenuis]